jgi:hypothetical protein
MEPHAIALKWGTQKGKEIVQNTVKETVKGYFPDLKNPYQGWKSIKIEIAALNKGDFSAFAAIDEPERSLLFQRIGVSRHKNFDHLQIVKQIDIGGVIEFSPTHKFLFIRLLYKDEKGSSNEALEYKFEKSEGSPGVWTYIPEKLIITYSDDSNNANDPNTKGTEVKESLIDIIRIPSIATGNPDFSKSFKIEKILPPPQPPPPGE